MIWRLLRTVAPVVAIAAAWPAHAQQSPNCARLEAQLSAFDRSAADPARADQIRRYEDAAGKQQGEIDRQQATARRLGCGQNSFFVLCSGQGIVNGACVPTWTSVVGPDPLPFATTVNGHPMTSAGAIESAAAAGLVGNDSGVCHLSAALGTRTVAIFGATDPARWAPQGPRVMVLGEQGAWPTVNDVLAAVERLLFSDQEHSRAQDESNNEGHTIHESHRP